MKTVLTDNVEDRRTLSRNMIRDNYINSKTESLNPQIYKKELLNKGFYVYEDDKMIGGLYFLEDYYNWVEIYMLWIDKDYMGQRLGTLLIDEMKKYAQ